MSIGRFLALTYLLTMFLAALMPGHRLLGIPVETVAVVLLVILIVIYSVGHKVRIHANLGLGMAFFALAMLIWLVMGLANPQTTTKAAINQFDGFLFCVIMIFSTYFVLDAGLADVESIFYWSAAGFLLFGLLKVTAIAGILAGVLDWKSVIDRLDQYMDYDVVSGEITSGLFRFQFPNDCIAPYIIAFLVFHDRFGIRLNQWLRWLGVAVSTIVVLFSFSRYLWALSVGGVLIGAVTFRSPKLILGMILLAVLVFAANPNAALNWYDARFANAQGDLSDDIRGQQYEVLPNEIARHPLMGNGFGGSAVELLRDEEHPYGYEIQWLGYTMNFGFVGIGIMAAYFLAILIRLGTSPVPGSRYFLVALYVGFLAGAFTNPYLMCPPCALVISLLLAASEPTKSVAVLESSPLHQPEPVVS